MGRIEIILKHLLHVAGNNRSKYIWNAFLKCLDNDLIKNTLGQGNFSRFYNNHLSFFNQKEHNLIGRLIFEIEHFNSKP